MVALAGVRVLMLLLVAGGRWQRHAQAGLDDPPRLRGRFLRPRRVQHSAQRRGHFAQRLDARGFAGPEAAFKVQALRVFQRAGDVQSRQLRGCQPDVGGRRPACAVSAVDGGEFVRHGTASVE